MVNPGRGSPYARLATRRLTRPSAVVADMLRVYIAESYARKELAKMKEAMHPAID